MVWRVGDWYTRSCRDALAAARAVGRGHKPERVRLIAPKGVDTELSLYSALVIDAAEKMADRQA